MIKVRAAHAEDMETILELASAFTDWFAQQGAETNPLDRDKMRRALTNHAFCDHPHLFLRLAEKDGRPVGYSLFNISYWSDSGDAVLFLSSLYASPEGAGAGTALMNDLKAVAMERRCGRLMWNVWDKNHQAFRFYEKFGAQMISDEPLMYLALQG